MTRPDAVSTGGVPRGNCRRDTAWTVLQYVRADALARLAHLEGEGCEAASARAYQRGRLEVVELDVWDALGLPRPTLP